MNSSNHRRWGFFLLRALPALTLFWAVSPVLAAAEEGTLPRIALTFGKGREVRIVGRGESLLASAEISAREQGPVRGSWDVSGPMGPQERNVFFREIGEFKQTLPVGAVMIDSPELPTAETGSYAVRISVISATGKEITKVIKYFVGEKPSRDLLGDRNEVPDVLETTNPAPEMRVSDETVLSWDLVPGSLAYQVELFDKTGDEQGIVRNPRLNACVMRLSSSLNRPPLVGLMVPAYKTETTIGEVSGDIDLSEGGSYLWRVVAMDRDGRELCESPLREFTFSGTP